MSIEAFHFVGIHTKEHGTRWDILFTSSREVLGVPTRLQRRPQRASQGIRPRPVFEEEGGTTEGANSRSAGVSHRAECPCRVHMTSLMTYDDTIDDIIDDIFDDLVDNMVDNLKYITDFPYLFSYLFFRSIVRVASGIGRKSH